MNLSIVIPLLNEEESLVELYQWIEKELSSTGLTYEILFIDDGSTDNSWAIIEKLHRENKNVFGLRFLKNYGKSQALHAGFRQTRGAVVVTLDADLQDSPAEIVQLYNRVLNEKLDLISGWKKKRYDSVFMKNLPSKLFNWAARKSSGIKLHDFNCGIKAYRKEVVKNINVVGEMHRYIPIIAKHNGFAKIGEQIVQHQPRKYGVTKFGWNRFFNGFFDLITLRFLTKFGKQPMYFFGFYGLLLFFVSFCFLFYLGIDKLYFKTDGRLIADRSEFFIALTMMVLGSQSFIAGFLGELIIKQGEDKLRYIVSTKLISEEK